MPDSDTDPTAPKSAVAASEQPDTEPGAVEPDGDGSQSRKRPPETSERPPKATSSKPPIPTPPPTRKPRGTGRVLAAFALLLSLAAIGGTGYLFYAAWLDDPEARVEVAIGAYQADLADLHLSTNDEIAALREELGGIGAELAAQRRGLAQARSSMAEAIADAVAGAPPTPREWKLAEVEYLLTIANHRLVMQEDAEGAQRLLALSDRLLADLDDFRLHEVRALLAEERLALETFGYADTQGVFLRLEALKGLLESLPLRLPEYAAGEPADAGPSVVDQDASLLDAFLDRLNGLVRFRRHEGESIRPLLTPDEAEYLEQHLRLALDRAQLAVLRRNQGIYETSLRAARDWLHRFVDPSRPAIGEAMAELDELRDIDLDLAPPDISRSLERLRELRRDGVDEASSA